MNRRKEGSLHEAEVCEYLQQHGYLIRQRNFRCRQGEIDIVAEEGKYLVFVEVKYRSGTRCGSPLEAVDRRKQYIICRVSDWYRMRYRISPSVSCRYDAASVCQDGIHLIRNAFAYLPPGL